MKRERRVRKRQMRRCSTVEISKQLIQAKADNEKVKKQLTFNQKLAQLYWDRWRHEVQERKHKRSIPSSHVHLPQIPRSALLATGSDSCKEVVGHGAFGIVRHMMYRGIDVAVKEFDCDCSAESVVCEASFLLQLHHPNLPLFFGCNTTAKPYYLVMQFYGIDDHSATIHKELTSTTHINGIEEWIALCGQLAEALRYLHHEAKCLHNDIKTDNVLLTKAQGVHVTNGMHSVVLIDFNKATRISEGRKYRLSPDEKTLHYTHYPHLAPEVVEGTSKQTPSSAVGRIFKQIAKRVICNNTEINRLYIARLASVSSQCSSNDAKSRP